MSEGISRDFQSLKPISEAPEPLKQAAALKNELESFEKEPPPEKKTNKRKAEVSPDKPSSVAFIEQNLETKDILDGFYEKTFKMGMTKEAGEAKKSVQQKMDKAIEEFFKKEAHLNMDDMATISSFASMYENSEQEKLYKKQTKEKITTNTNSDPSLLSEEDEGAILKQNKFSKANTPPSTPHPSPKSAKIHFHQEFMGWPKETVVRDAVSRYVSQYAASLIDTNPKRKKEVQDLRQQIEALGLSSKKLLSMEQNVTKLMRSDLKQKIKQSFLKLALSFSKGKLSAETLTADYQFDQLRKQAQEMGVFGGANGSIYDVREEAKEELREFVSDELDKALIQSKLKGDAIEELVKLFDKFNMIAGIAKFDASEYMRGVQKKIENLGLNHFIRPDNPGRLDTDTPSGGSKKDSENQQLEAEDIVLIEDQLRTLFMQHIMKRGLFQKLTLKIKIKKIEDELKRLGLYSEEKMERLKKEGHALAKIRLIDLLRESFEERATLLELKGAKYQLVQEKLKMALKGLRVSGESLPKSDIYAIRDQVNRAMFSVIKEDYVKAELLLEANPKDIGLIKQKKNLQTLLERLRSESGIQEEIKQHLFHNTPVSSDFSIVEAA